MEEEGPVRLSCRADLDIVNEIKESLSAKNLRLFRQSCFGSFLDLHELQFQGQLYLQLLLKQSHEMHNDKIVFQINNCETELGQREFALMTGLQFGPKSAIPSQSGIHKKTFKGKKEIMVSTVRQAFVNVAKKEKGNGELSLKLALLLLLYGLLLVRSRTSKRIDIRYIHLVDDLEAFNKFPWGRVAFDVVRDNVQNFLNGREHKDHVDVYGFGFVLQLWAYETIPIVATICASRPSRTRNATPRMLRWKATTSPRSEVLRINCFPTLKGGDERSEEMIARPKLQPTPSELKSTYFVSVLDWEKEIEDSVEPEVPIQDKVTRKRKRGGAKSGPSDIKEVLHKKKRKEKRPIDKEGSSDGSKSPESDAVFRARVEEKLGDIEKKQDRLEKFIVRIMLKLGCSVDGAEDVEDLRDSDVGCDEINDDIDTQPNTDPKGECDEKSSEAVAEETPPSPNADIDVDVSRDDDKGQEDGKGTNEQQTNTFETETATVAKSDDPIQDSFERGGIPSDEKATSEHQEDDSSHAETGEQNEGQVTCTDLVLHKDQIPLEDVWPIYDPLSSHVTRAQVAEFATWWGLTKESNTTVDTSVATFTQVNAKWFSGIWEASGWLSNENIDALFHLLLTKVMRWPTSFMPKWTCVDTIFWDVVTNRCYNHWLKSKRGKVTCNWVQRERTVMKYVFGRLPRLGNGQPWTALDFVYGVANVAGNHWVLYELRVKTKTIVVYDSQSRGGRTNAKHLAVFKHFAEVLESIYDEAYGVATGSEDVPNTSWQLQWCVDTPQQTNSSDCGVLCMKMLECLVCYVPLSDIDPSKCDVFRKAFCVELYKANNICF